MLIPPPSSQEKIEQGALRFGSGKEAAWDGIQWYWRCGSCMTTKVLDNMLMSAGNVEGINGFDELSAEQQEEVQLLFDERSSAGADKSADAAKEKKTKKSAAVQSGGVEKKNTKGKKPKATTKAKASEPEDDDGAIAPIHVD